MARTDAVDVGIAGEKRRLILQVRDARNDPTKKGLLFDLRTFVGYTVRLGSWDGGLVLERITGRDVKVIDEDLKLQFLNDLGACAPASPARQVRTSVGQRRWRRYARPGGESRRAGHKRTEVLDPSSLWIDHGLAARAPPFARQHAPPRAGLRCVPLCEAPLTPATSLGLLSHESEREGLGSTPRSPRCGKATS